MLLMMVVVLVVMMGSGSGHMGMMGHEKSVQHAEQMQEANPAQKDSKPSAGKDQGTQGHQHSNQSI